MRTIIAFTLFFILLISCKAPIPEAEVSEFAAVSQVDSGKAVGIMMTAYSTTLIADGQDQTPLRVVLIDSAGREITSAMKSIRFYVEGDALVKAGGGEDLAMATDTAGVEYYACEVVDGVCKLILQAGNTADEIHIEARADGIRPGGHDIHTISSDFVYMEPTPEQLPATTKIIGKMIGADVSFLPQNEARGSIYKDQGVEKDALDIIEDNGINYIRLRIFVNPENEKGYSPERGFCGLDYTLGMATRVKAAGMKLLLNFHYSDTWADPQKQFKPEAWAELDHDSLKDTLRDYTQMVIMALQEQGTPPDMVQVGNEINHGMLWPDGHIGNPDQLAGLLKAGVEGVVAADPEIPVMMHIALGGQNDESVFWLDNMIARGVSFDVIGISFYPRWHGTLDDLKYNLLDLVSRYNKPINVVEYSGFKESIHEIVFNLPDNMGNGTCIWEPLGRRGGGWFDREGEASESLREYKALNEKYLLGE
jgi:hypothetical protein